MDLSTALAVFSNLEKLYYEEDDGLISDNEPILDVRLDAAHSSEDFKRTYRVRVSLAAIKDVTGETWDLVLRVAKEHGLTTNLQNNGMELWS
jgi:hypothetical protein